MRAQDRANCSNATLHGGYGLHATGTIIAVGDFAAVGRFTFDGKGNLTGKLFTNAAGNYSESPEFRGTYSVSPDRVVTDTWGSPINTTHVSVIVDEGKGYLILNDTSGVGGGVAKKQFIDGKCSNAILNGTFGLLATGTVIGEGGFAAAGGFTFDGKGNLTGKVFFEDGSATPELIGTYAVNSDCIVTDHWSGSNPFMTPPGHVSVIVNAGKEYFILNPSNDRVVSGEAKRQ
jgi:hypothetical protein